MWIFLDNGQRSQVLQRKKKLSIVITNAKELKVEERFLGFINIGKSLPQSLQVSALKSEAAVRKNIIKKKAFEDNLGTLKAKDNMANFNKFAYQLHVV